jgi:cell division protein FtsI (penicillin-binding protein 3)
VIRTPLRPLARILSARAKGENPDAIERENLRLRHEVMRDSARLKAEGRLLLLGAAFVLCFGAVGARMGVLAAAEPVEPQTSARAPLSSRSAPISLTGKGGYWPPTL